LRIPNPERTAYTEPRTLQGAHIRNKPKTRDERFLRDRPDARQRYSAVPWALLEGKGLERIDLWVYCCISARAFKADTLQVGARWIAGCLKISTGRVSDSIKRLLKAGHVEIVEAGKGTRAAVYRLTSPVFAKRQKVIVSDRAGNRQTTRAELERKIELARKLKAGAA